VESKLYISNTLLLYHHQSAIILFPYFYAPRLAEAHIGNFT